MEAIALFFTKFSDEIIGAQLFLLFSSLSLAIYWMLIRKKKRETSEWVPAALVRAYIDRVRNDERDIRMKLFGEEASTFATSVAAPLTSMAHSQTVAVSDPNLKRELEALRAQLMAADQRAIEFDRLMNALKAEKATLEQKIKDAPVVTAPAAGANTDNSAALQKELDEIKAKLQEYEVIEDDLANLKKFQKENEQLKQKVEQYEKGGAASTVIAGTPAAPEQKTVIAASPEPAPKPEPVVASAEPAPTAPAPSPATESNTNVLQAVTPSIGLAPAPAPEKTAKQKEEELLSEFEKMLAS